HAHGAPFPHASIAAQIACDYLAVGAEKAGEKDEGRRYRRWAGGIRALLAGDSDRAAALFPEMPCVEMARAVGRASGEPANPSEGDAVRMHPLMPRDDGRPETVADPME